MWQNHTKVQESISVLIAGFINFTPYNTWFISEFRQIATGAHRRFKQSWCAASRLYFFTSSQSVGFSISFFWWKKNVGDGFFFLSNFSGRNLCLLAHVFNFDSLQEVDQGDATPTWTVDQRTARPERPSIWLRKLQMLWKRKNTSINSVLVVWGKIGNDLINFTNYGKNWHNAGKVGWLRGRF